MTAIPGVLIKKNTKGELTHVQIDVRRHKEAIPVLKEMGLLQQEEEEDHSVEDFYHAMVTVINGHYGTDH